ncbi:MAG: lipid biosynthesis B12-binding/radical SAM protein [Pseudomonadota bacterium]
MKKLLLVSANQHTAPYPVYPLGISYLKTYLHERCPDYDIQLFDFLSRDHAAFVSLLQEYRPDYVGISLRNIDDMNSSTKENFLTHYSDIIKSIRAGSSRSRIILGGPGYSIFPHALFAYLKPDFAIQGEGEKCFFNLLKALDAHTAYAAIEGLVYAEHTTTCLNSRKQYVGDAKIRFDEGLADFYWAQGGMLNIQTKRGCPYACIYCTYPLIEGSEVRTLSARRVADTLADLYFNKKIDYVFFTDSVFNLSSEYNFELAERIISKKMQLRWGGYFNFTGLDEKLLQVLKQAGLTHIEFGTESLSDTTLKNYNKPFTFAHILEASQLCRKLNINYANFLILGGYGETEETISETFENSKKLERTVFFPFIGMRIYPGTALHAIAIRENKISKDDSLLEPRYYISERADIGALKEKAGQTGRKWIFPDEDLRMIMTRMRARNKKGPLWEYLIQ